MDFEVAPVPAAAAKEVVVTGPPGADREHLAGTLRAAGYAVRFDGHELSSWPRFVHEVERELQRPVASRAGGVVAVIGVAELAILEARYGSRVRREVTGRLADAATGAACNRFGHDDRGHLLALLPGIDDDVARRRLERFAGAVAGTRFVVAGEHVRVTPTIGWAPLGDHTDAREAIRRARDAAAEAARHSDLRPVRFEPWMRHEPPKRRWAGTLVPALLPLLMILAGVGIPFAVYLVLDPGAVVYWLVVAALVLASALIVMECLYALDAKERPEGPPDGPYPRASAIICAYLPNEAATIVDTIESFLRVAYPGDLEIILAYNRPHPHPIEDVLLDLARRDSRLVLLPVTASTSKAQNLNAALSLVHGEFVGIFDADHHPDPQAFTQAWAWLSAGYDVVQGHCTVRNGAGSWVARLVAVEFEAIYAVSHPGRTRMFGFGLFGGSNGFWRTDLLTRTRMHRAMLTEDIDSTMRALFAGARIAVDRTIISRELAPTTLSALWHQRSRWAQGWLQVSLRHLWTGLRSDRLGVRQKAGLLVLLGWRELQPWLTLQIIPILMYAAWKAGGLGRLDWAVPICLLSLVFTLAAGPVQTWFAWRLAVPELRRHRAWFWTYFLISGAFYGHFKNLIARNAHLKEAVGDRRWRVTPR